MSDNPFSPSNTVDPINFVGREEEIKEYNKLLKQSSSKNPQHLLITGERGIGKSSLLRKLMDITDTNKYLIIRRDVDSSIKSLEELSYFILSTIKEEGVKYTSTANKVQHKVQTFFKEYKIEVNLFGLGGSIEGKEKRSTLQGQLYDELICISENLPDIQSICLFFDEASNINKIEGSWSFLRTVFSRLGENEAHFFLVIAGMPDLQNLMSGQFRSMERFFYPIILGPLSYEEANKILREPFAIKKRYLASDVIDDIYLKTKGHPYFIQFFGSCLYDAEYKIINKKEYDNIILPEIIKKLDKQVFKSRYEYSNEEEKQILKIIAKKPDTVYTVDKLSKLCKFKNDKLNEILINLNQKECLTMVKTGNYILFHPLFSEYIISYDI